MGDFKLTADDNTVLDGLTTNIKIIIDEDDLIDHYHHRRNRSCPGGCSSSCEGKCYGNCWGGQYSGGPGW